MSVQVFSRTSKNWLEPPTVLLLMVIIWLYVSILSVQVYEFPCLQG